MSIIRVEDLYKSYGEKTIFDRISFSIEPNDRIGLIGVNGTGKSTLLKVLSGIESPEEGTLYHANSFEQAFLPQEPELDEEATVLDEIYFGTSKKMKTMREYEKVQAELEKAPGDEKVQERMIAVQQRIEEEDAWEASTLAKQVLTKLGITEFFKKTKELSGGQKKRVAMAKALIQPGDLLILDEPTNHLDHQSIEWLEKYLASFSGALIVVTHDRYFLNRVTNRVFELDKGNLYEYSGNYEMYLEKKAEREENEENRNTKLQNTMRRELEWLRRGPKARGTKQKARVQRIHHTKETMQQTSKEELSFAIGAQRLGKKVMELENVSKAFPGRQLLDSFNLLIQPGSRIGIIGENGSGKSTLLNIMAGREQPDSGTVDTGTTVKIGYYTQNHEELDESKRVIEYIRSIAEVVQTEDGRTITAEQMLERFLFNRNVQWNYISRLSGGEKRRLYLLSILMTEPNVLMLDEPTNDLDTQTLGILEEYLAAFSGCVITVSHDRYFLDRVVDHLLIFDNTPTVKRFQGSYSDFLTEQAEKPETISSAKKAPEKKKPAKLSYNEKKEWESIEEDILETEEQSGEIQKKIDAAGSDFESIQKWMEEKQKLDRQTEYLFERWEELSAKVEPE
ncbi:ATP-binding cassette subfamily F protein uup [Sinobaca qinghaiensis]|uniref:ATP-binding cassette subfamily F protein uup n=1 Tax=Sinobaca qinghaiensis TaxID=342944 RepID=A0A419UZQ1_9BACL|nr:ABC-F family ATP-binding cassette domain-containing protein [Sinobaca qinghaiensis]RKD71141.1 ATP-binding cassette subfamily F protein uup [Sinobaca qinghaiensis]